MSGYDTSGVLLGCHPLGMTQNMRPQLRELLTALTAAKGLQRQHLHL